MIQSSFAAQAKAYFNDSLLKADYYLDGQERSNFGFHGKISDRIGISQHATKDVFHLLCENIHPLTGKKLTPRTRANRTVGYDINFHCPKSVSVLHVLVNDNHIQDAFEASVHETMQAIEADAQTRVRKNSNDENRPTSALLWADFLHHTARPVPGMKPDPHLHMHCFVFNVTWDAQEACFKAAQFHDINRDMPYYQALFHKKLSDRLQGLGYRIRPKKTGFEIEGVPEKAVNLFSKRTNEIGQLAKAKNITDAKALDKLGALTRSKKQKGLTLAQLKRHWRKQVADAGLDSHKDVVRHKDKVLGKATTAQQCVDHALLHWFERASVMDVRRLLETALRFAIGSDCTVEVVTDCLNKDTRLVKHKDGQRVFCTTAEVLEQEQRLVELAQAGQEIFLPLYEALPAIALEGEQKNAVAHVLTSANRISVIQGRAGTGKTTLMQEAVRLIQATGKHVIVAAPTAQAARGVLRDEGFAGAETVAKLLIDSKMQEGITDNVLWVDEAGLLGLGDMLALVELATQKNARLILSGDTKQHGSVARGDALRLLQTWGGVEPVTVNTIYRQKNKVYKAAVSALSNGDVPTAFNLLDGIGAIHAMDMAKPYASLAMDYIAALQRGKSVLTVSPTHQQAEDVTQCIRTALRQAKRIGSMETVFERLVPLSLTQAEKQEPYHYQVRDVLQFMQGGKGFKKGSRWRVIEIGLSALTIASPSGERHEISLLEKHGFEPYRPSMLSLAKNDTVRITRNGTDKDGKRLNNGQLLTVVSIDKNGDVKLCNRASKATYNLSGSFGHWAHGYCLTSHAAQGKTVDEVFIAQPATTFPATDMQQFYVSVSRGRSAVHIHTDDREMLLYHASQMRDRKSALELLYSEGKTAIVTSQAYRGRQMNNNPPL